MTVTVEPSVTTGPIAGSSKAYRSLDAVPGAKVPFRRVNLSNGEHFDLYDTSGPYTDADSVIDVTAGLPPRPGVVRDRGSSNGTIHNGVWLLDPTVFGALLG